MLNPITSARGREGKEKKAGKRKLEIGEHP
jgi:hypothetical protein